jgi:hypothetical protein
LSCAAAIAADIAFLSSDEKTNSLMYSSMVLIDISSILLSVLMRPLPGTAELPGALFLSVLVPPVSEGKDDGRPEAWLYSSGFLLRAPYGDYRSHFSPFAAGFDFRSSWHAWHLPLAAVAREDPVVARAFSP